MRPSDPRLLRQLVSARVELAGVVVTGVVASVLVLLQAWTVAGLVMAVLHHGTDASRSVVPWAAFVAVVFALRGLASWTNDVLAARAAGLVGTAMRDRVAAAALRRGTRLADTDATGGIAVLATRGVAAAEPYLTRYLPTLVLACVLPWMTLVAIGTQDLLSAGIVLATLPLLPVFGALVGLATRDRAREQWQAMASLSGHFLDVVRGLPTLVVHRRATAQSDTIAAFTDRYRRASLRTLRLAFASSAVLETVATISVALVAVTVGVRLASGSLDLHTSLVVLLLAPEAYWPLRRVGAEFHAAAEGVATFEAVAALSGDEDVVPVADVVPATGDLTARELTVRYPGRTQPALLGIDVTVPGRGVTALVGPSGCGKTTLLATLAGLLSPEHGSVRVAGRPVSGAAWRSQVAWLPQRPVFVSGSIADNLRLARPQATSAQLWDVLGKVALAERVRSLMHGLHTGLDEDGANLSAGERARLALARVVLAERPWVLLDEPTAHLDPLTTQVIVDTIADLGETCAVLTVAHDPAVLQVADTVIELAPAGSRAGVREGSSGAAVRRSPRPVVATAGPTVDARPVQARRGLAVATLLGAAASVCGVALTATAGWLLVQASTRPAVLTLLVAVVAVRAFGLARPALRYAERLRSHDVALRLLAQRRVEVYDALVPLVPGHLGRRRGDVLTAVVDDVDSVVDDELRVRMPVQSYVLVVLTSLAVAWAILPAAVPPLAVGALASAGLGFGLARYGSAATERTAVERRAALSGEVVELVQTATELAMWQAEGDARARVRAQSARTADATNRAATWLGLGRGAAQLAGGAGVAATALAVAPHVSHGVSGPMAALLVLVPLALTELSTPLAEAGALAARTAAASRRISVLEETRPLVVDTPLRPLGDSPELEVGSGPDGIWAGWDLLHPALRGISVWVPPGAKVGVVGSSGSGKSTLAATLVRFLDPTRGQIVLGGTPTEWLSLDDLRTVVGLVDDDPHVFATTVVENVRLARPGASDGEVELALRGASLGTWLDDLPDGLHTWVGDGHAQVSGGERARLAIARSLLSGQRVLVMDEPVAHLDHATAAQVAHEVLAADDGRSVIWITHDPMGLDLVDAVLDLDEHRALPLAVRP